VKPEIEQALNKAFDDAKVMSSRPDAYGKFGVIWDVKQGRPILLRPIMEPTVALDRQERES
jgi:hypothetical protein